MKSYFERTVEQIERKKQDNLKKLVSLSFEKLKEIEDYYRKCYKDAESFGYKESAYVNTLKYMIIDEAIRIKRGNEEEIWDSLT